MSYSDSHLCGVVTAKSIQVFRTYCLFHSVDLVVSSTLGKGVPCLCVDSYTWVSV
jgi:hypothetical protein